ncbi:hypothetical protein GW17_00055080 [Ensete ventricosum]|nr:hypothetical protein GW17_00055080 [Ensete ventricosum]
METIAANRTREGRPRLQFLDTWRLLMMILMIDDGPREECTLEVCTARQRTPNRCSPHAARGLRTMRLGLGGGTQSRVHGRPAYSPDGTEKYVGTGGIPSSVSSLQSQTLAWARRVTQGAAFPSVDRSTGVCATAFVVSVKLKDLEVSSQRVIISVSNWKFSLLVRVLGISSLSCLVI